MISVVGVFARACVCMAVFVCVFVVVGLRVCMLEKEGYVRSGTRAALAWLLSCESLFKPRSYCVSCFCNLKLVAINFVFMYLFITRTTQ